MALPSLYLGSQLSEGAIRLLFIHPSTDPQQPLECDCHAFELKAIPPYEALSYVWGPKNDATNVQILCNGEKVTIRAELAIALLRVRLTDCARIVWADALCINQNDNDEKSHQVPMMGSIFSQARRVVVWLRYGDPELIRQAIETVRYIGGACQRYDDEKEPNPDSYQNYKKLHLPVETFTPLVCQGLRELYNRSWFNRVWCVQEIRLAKDAIVFWGEQEVVWSDVGLSAWWIRDHNSTSLTLYEGAALLDLIYCTSCVTMYDAGMMKIPLLNVLQLYLYWNATDPRDQVYGLLNLVDPEEAAAIHLDYNKDVGEVYADTVLSIIRIHSRLTAFAHVSHPPDYVVEDDIPSWAPQWARNYWSITPFEWPRENYVWSACSGEPVEVVDDEHITHKKLRLSGVKYDTVSDIFAIMNHDNLLSPEYLNGVVHPYLELKRELIDRPSNSPNEAATERERDLAEQLHGMHLQSSTADTFPATPDKPPTDQERKLARTLTAGWLANRRYELEPDVDKMEAYYLAFTTMMHDLHARTHHLPIPPRPAARSIAADMYQAETYLFCRFRRCFRLSNGSFGLGPQCMRPDDIVVVLYGGDTPYVLRPSEGKYLLMGQAYVDEIMDGQLMHEAWDGKKDEEDFCLV